MLRGIVNHHGNLPSRGKTVAWLGTRTRPAYSRLRLPRFREYPQLVVLRMTKMFADRSRGAEDLPVRTAVSLSPNVVRMGNSPPFVLLFGLGAIGEVLNFAVYRLSDQPFAIGPFLGLFTTMGVFYLLACWLVLRARSTAASPSTADDRRIRVTLPNVLFPDRPHALRRFLSLCVGWVHSGTRLFSLSLSAPSRRTCLAAQYRVLDKDQLEGADVGLPTRCGARLPWLRSRPPSGHRHLQIQLPCARSHDVCAARPAVANP